MRMKLLASCLLLLELAVALVQQAPTLTILPVGDVIRRDLDQSGYFTCTSDQEHDVFWIDGQGRQIPNETDGRIYSSVMATDRGRELFFSNITTDDSDTYTCVTRYGINQEVTKSFELVVYMSIRWVDTATEQHPVTGTRALIKCAVNANPPAIIEWFSGGNQLIRNEGRFTPQKDGLVIDDITSADDGVYTCRAKVPMDGELSERDITVQVYSRPEITEPKPDIEVIIVEDMAGSIRCLADGTPTPTRTWRTGDGIDAAEIDGLTVDPADGTLTFVSARREMAGEYRCIAENAVDTVETTVVVVVYVKPQVLSYENVTSSEGESARLECHADGSPVPKVTFRKLGTNRLFEEDHFSNGDRAVVKLSQEGEVMIGVLTLRQLLRTDDGLYECVATSAGGQAAQARLLTVKYPPSLQAEPDTQVFTWTGHPASLACRAQAVPNATVAWSRDGRPPVEPQMVQIGDGPTAVLTVTPSDDSFYGLYKCTAVNELGSHSLDFTLSEATVPGSLADVVFRDVTSTTVEFDVSPPAADGGLPVMAYAVQYVTGDRPWEEPHEEIWAVGARYLLTKLTPEQSYRFRFAAENEVGLGQWSEELDQLMPTTAAPQAPVILGVSAEPEDAAAALQDHQELVVRSSESDSYIMRWEAGSDNGAAIDTFQISYHKVVSNKNIWQSVSQKRISEVDVSDDHSFRLVSLKPASYYHVELRAHNRIGYGEPAAIIVFTAPGVDKLAPQPSATASNLAVGVVVGVLLVLILLVDLTCYAVNSRGITHMLCARARHSSGSAKLNDEVASEKEPLQENGNGDAKNPPEPNGERVIRLPRQTSV